MIPAFAHYVLLVAALRNAPKPKPRRRGEQIRITHCVHGHEYDEANTHIGKDGKRNCRACVRERWRRQYRERSMRATR